MKHFYETRTSPVSEKDRKAFQCSDAEGQFAYDCEKILTLRVAIPCARMCYVILVSASL